MKNAHSIGQATGLNDIRYIQYYYAIFALEQQGIMQHVILQCFVVDPLAEYNMPQYLLREFKVTDARDGASRTVRQFQFMDWPEQVWSLSHMSYAQLFF